MQNNCNKDGFTLVELLSVLAIVGILVSILALSLGRIRLSAEKSTCASNLRQIGMGVQLYLQDNNGQFPRTSHSGDASQSWIYSLAPYLEDVDEVKLCPADPHYEERKQKGLSSYTINSYLSIPGQNRDPFGQVTGVDYTHFNRLPNPTRAILAFSVSDTASVSIAADHTHSSNWTSWAHCLTDIQPDRFASNNASGDSNYLYADSHVANLTSQELKSYFDRGINPADPSQQL